MESRPYSAIKGELVVINKSPDGDSLRFIPENIKSLKSLEFSRRLRVSEADGSVQLRLDAIDAPETHYTGEEQPLGKEARTGLLKLAGFKDVTFSDTGATVRTGAPKKIDATILAKMVEVHGRPVCYLFRGKLESNHKEVLTEAVLKQSLNAKMIESGLAYTTLYTSTPKAHRTYFTLLARKSVGKGVWAADKSAGFTLEDQTAIGPNGQLVLPKLFRRSTDYLRAKEKGFDGTIIDWLKRATSGGMSEDDELWVAGNKKRLSEVLRQDGPRLGLEASLLDVVFIAK